jgi:hypothetical protein
MEWYVINSKKAILEPLGISDKPHQRGASLLNTQGAHLEVLIRSGQGLAAKDADGNSDPYVVIHLLNAGILPFPFLSILSSLPPSCISHHINLTNTDERCNDTMMI